MLPTSEVIFFRHFGNDCDGSLVKILLILTKLFTLKDITTETLMEPLLWLQTLQYTYCMYTGLVESQSNLQGAATG